MIGERVRHLRKEKNMTLRQLADALGVPLTTLGNYERGDRKPDFQFFLDVANYFGVSMDYLTGRNEIKTPTAYQINNYPQDIATLLNNADPEVRKKLLDIHEKLYLIIVERVIAGHDNEELELLQQILNFIYRMKNGFGYGVNEGGFSYSTKLELTKLFLKEKPDFDKLLTNLFDIYLEIK